MPSPNSISARIRCFVMGGMGLLLGSFVSVESAHGQQSEHRPPTGRLHTLGSNRLLGALEAIGPDALTWKSSMFAEPIEFTYDALDAVLVDSPEKIPTPDDSVLVLFRDGARLYGEFAGFDDDTVTIQSQRHGRLVLSRNSVAELRWLRKGDLLWRGPNGLCDTFYKVKPPPAKKWFALDGKIMTVGWKQRIWIENQLAPKVEIEFQLSSTQRPEVHFEANQELKNFNIKTWGDEVVVNRGRHHLSLLKLDDSDRTLHLRLFWDHETDSGYIASADGKILGQFLSVPGGDGEQTIEDGIPTVRFTARELNAEKNKPPSYVSFNNFGRDLSLEHLEIRAWDGSLPEPSTAAPDLGTPRLELGDGSTFGVFSGTLLRGEENAVVVAPVDAPGSERRISLAEIESIVFDRLDRGSPARPEAFPDRLDFADGTLLTGKVSSYDDGRLAITSPHAPEPIPSATEGLIRLDFSARPDAEIAETFDKLTVQKETVNGHWEPAAGPDPRWRLPGSLAAVPVLAGRELEIDRAEPAEGTLPIPRPSALLHLTSGQTISGDLDVIGPDGSWLEMKNGMTETTRFEADSIRAIQFTGQELQTEGFRDVGWRIVRGKMGTNLELAGNEDAEADEEGEEPPVRDKLTLHPSGAWGHGSILQGDELQFTFQADQWGSLRLRMFGSSLDASDQETTRLLFAHFGSEVYCGFEQTPGNFARQEQVPAEPGKPVHVRLVWTDERIDIFVKGQKIASTNFGDQYPKLGHGLVFEPANLWGNGERKMSVWNFALKSNPGIVTTPPIDGDARERALIIPRFRRDDPPHHALMAWSGDLLRGTVTAATSDRFAVRTGLESHQIDTKRIAAAVWLDPPDEETAPDTETSPDAQSGKENKKTNEKNSAASQTRVATKPLADAFGPGRYSLLLLDGSHFSLDVHDFGPEFIRGQTTDLGECKVPVELVASILSGEKQTADPGAFFANWKLQHAPDPIPTEGDGEGAGAASPLVGKPAPPIELPILGDAEAEAGKFKLEKGKITILDFWATWCGPCVRALPEMLEAFAEFDPEKVTFVGVNQAEAPEIITPFLKQRGWPEFIVALDSRQDVGRAYGVEGIPHTVIIDAEGNIAWVTTGFRPGGAEEAADKVRELLSNGE